MYLTKYVRSTIQKDYFFIKGNLGEIDSSYFINKINEGINSSSNLNEKTNIIGGMTSWDFFKNDKQFLKLVLPFMDYIDKENFFSASWYLKEAWGFEEKFSMYTKEHDHGSSLWSGVIYLSKADQPLIFPEIQEEIKPDVANFALFSSFLKHKTKNRISDDKTKYGLSFNFNRS